MQPDHRMWDNVGVGLSLKSWREGQEMVVVVIQANVKSGIVGFVCGDDWRT